MKCPHCGNGLEYPAYAWDGATTYQQPVRVTTKCCYKIVTLTPFVSVMVKKATGTDWGNGPEDDWGVPEGVAGQQALQ